MFPRLMCWTTTYFFEKRYHPRRDEVNLITRKMLLTPEDYSAKNDHYLFLKNISSISRANITNLKELRLYYKKSPIRILFAFDPRRQAVIILGGNKEVDERWYKINIPKAEKLYFAHLQRLKEEK